MKFDTVLTGHNEQETIAEIQKLAKKYFQKTIAMGYRTWKAEYWLRKLARSFE